MQWRNGIWNSRLKASIDVIRAAAPKLRSRDLDVNDEAARIAAAILETRRRRANHLPAILFSEPAWSLLLILFIADSRGERLTASQACHRTGETMTVAQRWLKVLEVEDLATCHERCDDGHLVTLTPKGIDAVEACIMDVRSCVPLQSQPDRPA